MNKFLGLLLITLISPFAYTQVPAPNITIHVINNTNKDLSIDLEEKIVGPIASHKEVVAIPAGKRNNIELNWHTQKNKIEEKSSFTALIKSIKNGNSSLKLHGAKIIPNNPYKQVAIESNLTVKTASSREIQIDTKRIEIPMGNESDHYSILLTVDGQEFEKSSLSLDKKPKIGSTRKLGA